MNINIKCQSLLRILRKRKIKIKDMILGRRFNEMTRIVSGPKLGY